MAKKKAEAPPQRLTRFTKVKFDGQKVRLEYHVTRPGGGEPDEFLVHCSDKPLPSFNDALQALVGDVCHICEFPSSEASKFRVRGVSMTYDDGLGVVITALRTLMTSSSPLLVNSPHLLEAPRATDPGGYCLPPATVRRVRLLIEEAERYLKGDRAQGSLFEAPSAEITLIVSELPPDGEQGGALPGEMPA